MYVLRYYSCMTYVFGSSDPWFVILSPLSYVSLVLCCDIYRSTLISIMYPTCMITVHDRKLRALQGGSRFGRFDLTVGHSAHFASSGAPKRPPPARRVGLGSPDSFSAQSGANWALGGATGGFRPSDAN